MKVQSKFLVIMMLLSISLRGYAEDGGCIDEGDLKDISKDLPQYVETLSSKKSYCKEDLGSQQYQILKTLVLLKTISPKVPKLSEDDAFTYQAIEDKDWWSYFVKRTNEIVVDEKCKGTTIAYTMRLIRPGVIYICPHFFKKSMAARGATIMHEVRHFDGHGHVTCTRGEDKGSVGACDETIMDRGSYAIHTQVLVSLGRSDDLAEDERSRLQAESVYMAFNKFNSVPKFRMVDSIFLSNKIGEVYRWVIDGSASLIKVLAEPARVTNSANTLTLFPVSGTSEAYRMESTMSRVLTHPGLFARHYNTHTPSERASYASIFYFGLGGLLKNNELTTICDTGTVSLGHDNLDERGQFTRLISVSAGGRDADRGLALVSDKGDLLGYKCKNRTSKTLEFYPMDMKISAADLNLIASFGLGGRQYMLSEEGVLKEFLNNDGVLQSQLLELPIENQSWISATPFSVPEVF